MKDKNGIEIKSYNCKLYTQGFCGAIEVCLECYKTGFFNPTTDAYKARIAELHAENALLKELRFTDEEIDFIKKAISMAILDCETNPPKPSDETLNLMWSIKSKCDAILKEER